MAVTQNFHPIPLPALVGNNRVYKGTPPGKKNVFFRALPKGTGDFEWCRQTMDELSVFGTSRTSNELKSEP